MRYRLRTLLILLAVLPPVLAALWFSGSGGLVVGAFVAAVGVAGVVVLVLVSALARLWDA